MRQRRRGLVAALVCLQARLRTHEHHLKGPMLVLQMMKVQRIAAVRTTCLCRTSRMTENNWLQMPELGISSNKAMMLELGALADMKPTHGIQTTMLNMAQIMVGILMAM